jgi:short-subunit dehydrogenase
MNMAITDPNTVAPKPSQQRRGLDLGPLCIVVTGASSGLGAALARAYAAPERVLGLIGRNAGRLEAVADSCRQCGAAVETAVLDVADPAAVSTWMLTFDTKSPVDLLIANAGISAGTRPDGSREGLGAAREVVRINLLGVINSVESLLPRMLERHSGQIAVVASMAAYRGLPDSPAYCASKAGVLTYGESLRSALEPRGVRVSVIVPGFFASPMSARYRGHKLFLLSESEAVAHVMRGLRRSARRIVFPWQLALLLRLVGLLPAWFGDRIMRAFPFRIAARPDDRF